MAITKNHAGLITFSATLREVLSGDGFAHGPVNQILNNLSLADANIAGWGYGTINVKNWNGSTTINYAAADPLSYFSEDTHQGLEHTWAYQPGFSPSNPCYNYLVYWEMLTNSTGEYGNGKGVNAYSCFVRGYDITGAVVDGSAIRSIDTIPSTQGTNYCVGEELYLCSATGSTLDEYSAKVEITQVGTNGEASRVIMSSNGDNGNKYEHSGTYYGVYAYQAGMTYTVTPTFASTNVVSAGWSAALTGVATGTIIVANTTPTSAKVCYGVIQSVDNATGTVVVDDWKNPDGTALTDNGGVPNGTIAYIAKLGTQNGKGTGAIVTVSGLMSDSYFANITSVGDFWCLCNQNSSGPLVPGSTDRLIVEFLNGDGVIDDRPICDMSVRCLFLYRDNQYPTA